MKTNQAAAIILTIVSSILALVSISTDEWTSSANGKRTSGLFTLCKDPMCSTNFTIAITTSALFVSGIVELLFGSIIIFIGWNKSKAVFENLGLFLLFVGTIQFCSGSTIFTSTYYAGHPGAGEWGLSFVLAWGATAASVLATFLALWVFFKRHRVTVTLKTKETTKTPKAELIKEARV